MINPTGNITLNGITDADLLTIIQTKMRHEGKFVFNPQQLTAAPPQAGKPAGGYNNAMFMWTTKEGLSVVNELVGALLKTEDQEVRATDSEKAA